MTITKTDRFGNEDTFEIVNKIPNGFFVWNIGENMGTDEYIPICEDLHPEDKEDYRINPYTLKAIKLDPKEVHILRDAAGYGVVSYKEAKKALNRKNPKSYMMKRKRELAEKAISIFEKIS